MIKKHSRLASGFQVFTKKCLESELIAFDQMFGWMDVKMFPAWSAGLRVFFGYLGGFRLFWVLLDFFAPIQNPKIVFLPKAHSGTLIKII